jgi:hypothetical protein
MPNGMPPLENMSNDEGQWLVKREESVLAKRKGTAQTYWINQGTESTITDNSTDAESKHVVGANGMPLGDLKDVKTTEIEKSLLIKLVGCNVDVLRRSLKNLSISDDNLRFDLSTMDSMAIDEATTNVAFLSKKPLSDGENSLPQLEPLTTYDDSASIASISTVGTSTSATPTCISTSTTDRLPRRSMFIKYWKTTGQEPLLPLLRRPQALHLSSSQSPPSPTELAPSTASESPSSPISQRRSIFALPQAQRSCSVPSLSVISTTSDPHRPITRKSASSGELKASSSCLREARFSGDKRRGASLNDISHSCSSSSVRFDMESVDVLLFEKPLEHYAVDGWSKNFVD